MRCKPCPETVGTAGLGKGAGLLTTSYASIPLHPSLPWGEGYSHGSICEGHFLEKEQENVFDFLQSVVLSFQK